MSHQLFTVIPNRILNILISPGGRGKLGRPLDFNEDLDLEGVDMPLRLIVPLALYMTLPLLLRYILGHVASTLLILEASQQDKAMTEKEERIIKKRSTFRSVQDAFRLIYQTQGIYTFIRAMMIGSAYLFTHNFVGLILETFIFRYDLIKPLAFSCSSALLCEFHLAFTCATVSAKRVPILLRRTPDQSRWKQLAIPALLFGLTEALMNHLYDFVAMALISQEEALTSKRAAAEVLAVVIMLAFRLIALLPTCITLTLAEAAFLPVDLETVVPSPTKERGLKIGELVGEKKPSTGLRALTGFLEPVRTSRYMWLIELHLKKCFIQICLEVVLISSLVVSFALTEFDDSE